MQIIHVSTNDMLGGAARAALRLHLALLDSNIDSKMVVEYKSSNYSSISSLGDYPGFRHKIIRAYRKKISQNKLSEYDRRRAEGMEIFSDSFSKYPALLSKNLVNADLINLHWVSGLVDYNSFFQFVPSTIPVVFTLHDMNPFTGGCHFSGNCTRYISQCGACPELLSTDLADLSSKIWQKKNIAYSNRSKCNTCVVAPSQWIADRSRESSLMSGFSNVVIPNGLDTSLFSPRDTRELRAKLGIGSSANVIGFVSDNTLSNRKGFALFADAIAHSEIQDLVVISIGGGNPKLPLGVTHRHIGPVKNDFDLSEFYSLFDVFCCPSINDNLPNTVLEAMACGTPVVAFEIGGMPDMIVSGHNGILCKNVSSSSLAKELVRVISDCQALREMSLRARKHVLTYFSLSRQAASYLELYRSLGDYQR